MSTQTSQKITIQNRKGQRMVVVVECMKKNRGLAFVMHGLGGFKEQPHLLAMASVLKEAGYNVVRFDTTNTLDESEGNYEDATTTNYYEDLEDVIVWTRGQAWYAEPFILCGHSLGGISTALFAENYPEKVKALAPISTAISGKLRAEARGEDRMKEWEKTGWEEAQSVSLPGVIKRLKWSHMEDAFKYDLMSKVSKLTMPVLMMVGDQDTGTPVEQQKILYNALTGDKELHIIKGAPHTFRTPEHLAEIKEIMRKWLVKVGSNS